MKALLLASVVMLATTTLARANNDVVTYGGTMKCSEVLGWQHTKVYREQVDMWIMGAWSGANANDQTEGNGRVGDGADATEIIKAVIAECRKNPKQDIQGAFYGAWFRYRDRLVAGSDS